ncbi:MAG: PsbP-related protein [Promethearchaeia archaeon]
MDLRTYQNEKYGIQFQYPPNWERGEAQLGAIVVIYAPSLEKGFFRENLSFMVYQLSNADTSLKEYLNRNLHELEASLEEVKQINQKTITFGDQEGFLTEYIGGFGEETMKIRQYTIKVQDEIYILSHSYLASQDSKHIKTVDKIVKSFEFLEQE